MEKRDSEPAAIQGFSWKQRMGPFYKAAAKNIGEPQSDYSIDQHRPLVMRFLIGDFIQPAVPQLLQTSVLFFFLHRLHFIKNPRWRSIYDSLRREIYWVQIVKNVYDTVDACKNFVRKKNYRRKYPFGVFPLSRLLELISKSNLDRFQLTADKNQHVLLNIELYSKLTRSIQTQGTSFEQKADEFCNKWVIPYGIFRLLAYCRKPPIHRPVFCIVLHTTKNQATDKESIPSQRDRTIGSLQQQNCNTLTTLCRGTPKGPEYLYPAFNIPIWNAGVPEHKYSSIQSWAIKAYPWTKPAYTEAGVWYHCLTRDLHLCDKVCIGSEITNAKSMHRQAYAC